MDLPPHLHFLLPWVPVLLVLASPPLFYKKNPLLFNAANLLKYLEIWVNVSHSSLVKDEGVRRDLIRVVTSSAVALLPVSSP